MVIYKPTSRCPRCGRPPNVRFSKREVLRARGDRQMAHIQSVKCTRLTCRTVYWIRAAEIAAATPVGRNGGLPVGLPERAYVALGEANIASVEELRTIDDWTTIPGIGPATEREMRKALAERLP